MNHLTPEEVEDFGNISDVILGEDNEVIGYFDDEDADLYFSDPNNQIEPDFDDYPEDDALPPF